MALCEAIAGFVHLHLDGDVAEAWQTENFLIGRWRMTALINFSDLGKKEK
jgi:hypothetical protein